jgi:hypothetical protein
MDAAAAAAPPSPAPGPPAPSSPSLFSVPQEVDCGDVASMEAIGTLRYRVWEEEGSINPAAFGGSKCWLDPLDYVRAWKASRGLSLRELHTHRDSLMHPAPRAALTCGPCTSPHIGGRRWGWPGTLWCETGRAASWLRAGSASTPPWTPATATSPCGSAAGSTSLCPLWTWAGGWEVRGGGGDSRVGVFELVSHNCTVTAVPCHTAHTYRLVGFYHTHAHGVNDMADSNLDTHAHARFPWAWLHSTC